MDLNKFSRNWQFKFVVKDRHSFQHSKVHTDTTEKLPLGTGYITNYTIDSEPILTVDFCGLIEISRALIKDIGKD